MHIKLNIINNMQQITQNCHSVKKRESSKSQASPLNIVEHYFNLIFIIKALILLLCVCVDIQPAKWLHMMSVCIMLYRLLYMGMQKIQMLIVFFLLIYCMKS